MIEQILLVLSLWFVSDVPRAVAWSLQHTQVQRFSSCTRSRSASCPTNQQQSPPVRSSLFALGGFVREGDSSESLSVVPLKATSVASSDFDGIASRDLAEQSSIWMPSQSSSWSLQEFWIPVLSSSLLITGNTFGAGSLVLPTLASEPGLGPSVCLFGVAYLLNLVSGLTLANVAITQYETSLASSPDGRPQDVPSSFQEFVQANLKSPELAALMSAVSFCVNSLVMSFDISRIKVLFDGLIDPTVSMSLWGLGLFLLGATQTSNSISRIAGVCAIVLFASFGSLLLPGLASLVDPIHDLFTPGAADFGTNEFWHSVGDIAPVIVMCAVFQNIVPTIVRLHGYHRAKSVASIVLGSFLPVAMYVAWCWACIGQGGIDLAVATGGNNNLLSIFTLATLSGSSIGCILSCNSEIDVFVKKNFAPPRVASQVAPSVSDEQGRNERFHITSSLATVGLPLGLNFALANDGDLTGALQVAGGVGTPLLYGVIPALMAYRQMQRRKESLSEILDFESLGLGVLAAASTGMFCGNLMDCANNVIHSFLPTVFAAQEFAAVVA